MSRTDGVVVAAASHRLYCVANLREKEEESRGSRGDTLPSVQDAAWCDKTLGCSCLTLELSTFPLL
jgi:hypothetical protein